MWNSRRVKRIVGSFSVVTATTLGLSLTDIVEENTYGPMSFEVIGKALANTKSDLENHEKYNNTNKFQSNDKIKISVRALPTATCYYGSPEFFIQKQKEEDEEWLRIYNEKKKQEEIKRNQEKEAQEKENQERLERIKKKIEESKKKVQ